MTMTRRDFEALASALGEVRPEADVEPEGFAVWEAALAAVGTVCYGSNERFDRGRFERWARDYGLPRCTATLSCRNLAAEGDPDEWCAKHRAMRGARPYPLPKAAPVPPGFVACSCGCGATLPEGVDETGRAHA